LIALLPSFETPVKNARELFQQLGSQVKIRIGNICFKRDKVNSSPKTKI